MLTIPPLAGRKHRGTRTAQKLRDATDTFYVMALQVHKFRLSRAFFVRKLGLPTHRIRSRQQDKRARRRQSAYIGRLATKNAAAYRRLRRRARSENCTYFRLQPGARDANRAPPIATPPNKL
jgi:hypothetical protein